MPSQRGIRAGKAYVELSADDSKLTAGLTKAKRQLNSFAQDVGRIGAVFGGVGASILGGFVPAIQAASRKQETMNKFMAVFGDEAGEAAKFADELADAVGRNSTQLKDDLSTYQSFFQGLGLGAKEARKLSQEMTALELDFASFFNLSDEEALQRFISALSGSSEVLDKFGINTKVAALEPKTAYLFGKDFKDASELEKAIARLSIIKDVLGRNGALGDAEKTAGSFANQMKRLNAEFETAKVVIGEAVLPTVTAWVNQLNESVPGMRKFIEDNASLITTLFKVGVGLVTFGGSLLGMAGVAKAASFVIGIFTSRFGLIAMAVQAGLAGITWAVTQFWDELSPIVRTLEDAARRLGILGPKHFEGADEFVVDKDGNVIGEGKVGGPWKWHAAAGDITGQGALPVPTAMDFTGGTISSMAARMFPSGFISQSSDNPILGELQKQTEIERRLLEEAANNNNGGIVLAP